MLFGLFAQVVADNSVTGPDIAQIGMIMILMFRDTRFLRG
jgi:hypothetical protein